MLDGRGILDRTERLGELAMFGGVAEAEEPGDPMTLELGLGALLLPLLVVEVPTPLVNEKDVDEKLLRVGKIGVDGRQISPLPLPDGSAIGTLDEPGKFEKLSEPPLMEVDKIELCRTGNVTELD